MKRAVGWCMNDECPEWIKGVFLMNASQFKCKCGTSALVVGEYAKTLNSRQEFREVRVEYNYDPLLRKYREIAIVRNEDPDLEDANVLTLYSPLIKTDKRALRMAEGYLAQMLLYPAVDGDLPPLRETILDFDKPMDKIKKDLEELHYRLFYCGKVQKSE